MNRDDISCLLGNRCKLRQFDSWNIDKIDEVLETDSKHSGLKISLYQVCIPRSLRLNCPLESEKCLRHSTKWDSVRQCSMACGFIKISQIGAGGESRNKNRCVNMHNQKGLCTSSWWLYSVAYSISVIMLVDELIANLLNIHNQQFLLNDNELSQSSELQTLMWHAFIGSFLPLPPNHNHPLPTSGTDI